MRRMYTCLFCILVFPFSKKNISSLYFVHHCVDLFSKRWESERQSYRASMAARTIVLPLLVIIIAASLSWVSSSTPEAASAFVKKTISSHKIVIFSKSYCPYSLFSLLHPIILIFHCNLKILDIFNFIGTNVVIL